MKTCFKCGIAKPTHGFYRHPRTADGRLGKCIECTKDDVRRNRRAKRLKYSIYERERAQRPERRILRLKYSAKHRRRHPERAAARRKVAYEKWAGRLNAKPCEVCGASVAEAHHPDYSRPLDVRWLCFRHHREAHGQQATSGYGT